MHAFRTPIYAACFTRNIRFTVYRNPSDVIVRLGSLNVHNLNALAHNDDMIPDTASYDLHLAVPKTKKSVTACSR